MVFSSLSPTTTGTTTRPPMSPRHKFKKQHHHDPRKLCDKAKSCPVESSCTLTSTGTSNSRSKNESKNERNHCTSAKAKKSARINEFQNTVHEYQAVPLHLYSHVWYDHHETEDMLEEMKSTLELYAQFPDLIDEGHQWDTDTDTDTTASSSTTSPNMTATTMWGLERRTHEGHAERMEWRQATVKAVLDEQDRQWEVLSLSEPTDDMLLAMASLVHTREAVRLAKRMGRHMAINIDININTDSSRKEQEKVHQFHDEDDETTVTTVGMDASFNTLALDRSLSSHCSLSNSSVRLSSFQSSQPSLFFAASIEEEEEESVDHAATTKTPRNADIIQSSLQGECDSDAAYSISRNRYHDSRGSLKRYFKSKDNTIVQLTSEAEVATVSKPPRQYSNGSSKTASTTASTVIDDDGDDGNDNSIQEDEEEQEEHCQELLDWMSELEKITPIPSNEKIPKHLSIKRY